VLNGGAGSRATPVTRADPVRCGRGHDHRGWGSVVRRAGGRAHRDPAWVRVQG